jgi:hypothetical protein
MLADQAQYQQQPKITENDPKSDLIHKRKVEKKIKSA